MIEQFSRQIPQQVLWNIMQLAGSVGPRKLSTSKIVIMIIGSLAKYIYIHVYFAFIPNILINNVNEVTFFPAGSILNCL